MFTLNLGSLIVHLKANAAGFNSVFDSVEQKINNVANKMAAAGAILSATLTVPLTKALKDVTKEFAKFDNELNKTMAVLNTHSQTIRAQFEQIAYDISKNLPISTVKVSEGFHHLAQAGLTADEALTVMPMIAQFATAGMFNLETATELLVQSQKALGLSSTDSAQNLTNMTRVADSLTAASIKTTASIHDFSTALSNYAGQALRLVGKDVEEGVSVLMAFAQQGIKSEDAGYRMSMMLRDLQKATVMNSRSWKTLGVDVYDSAGQMRNVADIIIDLETVMEGWSDEQKRVGMSMLGFQDRALMATVAILGLGKQIKQWQGELRTMGGITKQVAQQMSESWIHQMKLMWESMAPLRISIGEIVAERLLKLRGIVDRIMEVWRKMSEEVRRSVVHWAMFAAAIGPVLLALSALLKIIAMTVTNTKALIVATLGYCAISPIGVVNGLVAAFVSLGRAMKIVLTMNISQIFINIIGAIAGLSAVILSSVAGIALLGAIIYTLRAAWTQNLSAIKDRMQEWFNAFKKGYEWLSETAIGPFLRNMVNAFGSAFQTIKEGWSDFIADLASSILATIPAIKTMAISIKNAWSAPTLSDMWAELKSGFQQSKLEFSKEFVNVFEDVKPVTDNMNRWVKEKFEITGIYLDAFGEATVEHWKQLIETLKVQFNQDVDAIVGFLKAKFPEMVNVIDLAAQDSGSSIDLLNGKLMTTQELVQEAIDKFINLGRMSSTLNVDDWSQDMSTGEWKRPESAHAKFPFHLDMEEVQRVEGMAKDIVNSLYSGLDDASQEYWDYQQERMNRDIALWTEYADVIADKMGIEEDYLRSLIKSYEEYQNVLLGRKQIEQVFGVMDQVFEGARIPAKEFFDFQEQKLQYQMSIWEEYADRISNTLGMEKDKVIELMNAYLDHQRVLLEIQELKATGGFFDGFKAGVMEMQEELRTIGELGAEIAKSLRDNMLDAIWDIAGEAATLEDALRRIALSLARQAFDWSGQQLWQYAMKGFTFMSSAGSATGITDISRTTPTGGAIVHTGGVPSVDPLPIRMVDSSVFANAQRAHTGIGPGERGVVIEDEEGIFTEGQMKAIGKGMSRGRNAAADTELINGIRELIYLTRRQKIVQPVVIDRREDTATLYRRDYLRRGKLTKGMRG